VKTATFRTVKARPCNSLQQRFLTAIRTGKNPGPDFRRGWEVQRVLDAAFTSDAESRTVRLRF
jgi:predicted dehydrogenase